MSLMLFAHSHCNFLDGLIYGIPIIGYVPEMIAPLKIDRRVTYKKNNWAFTTAIEGHTDINDVLE